MEDPPFIGDWHFVKKLGSGGFGLVKLWQNRKTGQNIAIKKCQVSPCQDKTSLEKLKERWKREIQYMTHEIKNENIVQGLLVKPDSFLLELNKSNQFSMPVLVMEYCEGGDLRTALSEHHNTSGLIESEVRSVLKCLLSAISYLHQIKISHRDIKPENCVIKTNQQGEKIYKLTDLGYARQIDRQSLVASLVGTIEYVAPELLITDKYSNSVDYWSFGVIAFEVIAGVRPFVPHMPLAQWMPTVKKKKSEHICVTENIDGIQYLSTIFAENQISSCFKAHMENWLKLALEWNPKQRGHVFETPATKSVSFADMGDTLPPISILKIFTMLDEVLSRKILTVFCLYTYKTYSYDIDATTTMNDLLDLIEKSTSIPKDKIRLTIPVENHHVEHIDENTKPIDLFFDKYFDKPMLFVGYSGMLMKSDNLVGMPELVEVVFNDYKTKLRPHILKRFVYNVFYFIRNEQKKYVTALDGFYNYSLQLNHQIELYEININKMLKSAYGLNGAVKLVDRMLSTLKEKNEQSEQVHETQVRLGDQCQKLQINIGVLIGACEKIVKRFRSVHRRSRDSLNHPLLEKGFQNVDYFQIAELSKKYQIIREQFASKIYTESQQTDIFKCAYNCLKKRDQLLRAEPFLEWQRQTVNVSIEMEEIKKTVKSAIAQGEKYDSELNKISDDIIDYIQSQQYHSNGGPDLIPDIENILDRKAETSPVGQKFHVGQPVSWNMNGKSLPFTSSNGNDECDATSIIEDNEHLRQRFADVINQINSELKTDSES